MIFIGDIIKMDDIPDHIRRSDIQRLDLELKLREELGESMSNWRGIVESRLNSAPVESEI